MHSHLADVFARLDASRAALRDAIARIPEPLRRRRPAPERWSPLEIVEHLTLTDRRFTRTVGVKIQAALAGGLAAEASGRDVLPGPTAARIADRTVPRSAPEELHPSGTLGEQAIWTAADEARAGLRDIIMQADGLALSTVVHEHAAFGALTVYQWVELLAAHELRHVQQIAEAHEQIRPSR